MIEKELKLIGLTKREINVYLALLKIGENTTGKISEESKVSTAKIYEVLAKLIEKGLATFIIKSKTKYFSPTSPKKILEYVEEKKNEIDNTKSRIEKLIPNLSSKYNKNRNRQEAVVYKDIQGLRSALYETMELGEAKDEWLAFGVTSQIPESANLVWPVFNKQLLRRKHRIKLIVTDKAMKKKAVKGRLVSVKIIDNNATAPMSIFGGTVLIYNWEELSVIKITNKNTAESFRKFFENLWSIAR